MFRSVSLLMLGVGLFLAGQHNSFFSGVAFACASCGSGGDEPMVLFPAETTKLYSGITFASDLASTGPDGSILASNGPQKRATYTFAIGQALNRRLFLVFGTSLLTNMRDERSTSGAGDPTISSRWTILMPNLAEPWVPQVQVSAGWRSSMAASIHSSTDENLLDVFGSGFTEIRGGVDVWFGMLPVKPGFAVTATESLPARYGGLLLQPGRLLRATASLTTLVPAGNGTAKIAAGITADRRSASRLDGEFVSKSAQSAHGFFAAVDATISDPDVLKLQFSRQGAWGERINAVASNSWSLAWSRVIQ